MTVLDDGRLVAAWDVKPAPEAAPTLAGRLLDESARPTGRSLRFDHSPAGGDWDPCLAPAPRGGFVMVWTGNEGPESDCLARFYDAQGRGVGEPLALGTRVGRQLHPQVVRLRDGSWAATWQDDLSGRLHGHLRRITGAYEEAELGPVVSLGQRESLYLEDRKTPDLAPLGDGVLGVWDDCRRMRGHDVWVRILGPAFDVGLELD